jgi:hypothetical protein
LKCRPGEGPVGETIVFANVLEMVLSELGRLWFGAGSCAAYSFGFSKENQGNATDVYPLAAGLALTFGIYSLLGSS